MATMTSGFSSMHSSDFARPDWLTAEHETGTTICAIEFDGGVVIGADSRTTTGAYIANRVTDKLTKVTDYIYCCRSGSAADTQAIADIVNYQLNFYKMEHGEEPLVKMAGHVFKDMCYNYRDSLTAGILVAGWDKREGGQVYNIPLGGMITRSPFSIGGSGSTYLYGYVDSNYRPGMSKEECLKFIANDPDLPLQNANRSGLCCLDWNFNVNIYAVSLAINRDGSSGGIVRLATITKDGVERFTLTGDQIPKFYEDS